MIPEATSRLRFREMAESDLDSMAELLGDPRVMEFYPAPKTRAEAAAWIDWNRRNYADSGVGLWIVETLAGEFVGDCGLTWQDVDGELRLEVGYHVLPSQQRRGYAVEAATACRDLAAALGQPELVAIIHPDNAASRTVAERIGMRELGRTGWRTLLGMDLMR